ncbi:purine and uridine phosphorylase [Aspergillus bertholletiae]|uniref:Purine and uridine phosphorylase n=1 Tax=Aspergillus bertholletiae TaxID=1226010 RepID=A0A5N7AV74_9EURO|nr:purine and uridine phosphorylase [Aspergillus bertholletiae]
MSFTRHDYTVAWICALPLELAAAKAMLENEHSRLPQPQTDHNVYTLGSVSGHNVVMASLPSGVYGTISASTVVSHMVSTYPNIRFGLMVGIGGGVPSQHADIRLGDIVISKPTATSSGVIQYDYGKTLHDGRFQRIGSLNKPPPVLLKAIAQLESDNRTGQELINQILSEVRHKSEEMQESFSRPKDDWLFQPTYNHEDGEESCSVCDQTQLVNRPERTVGPYCHYGLIASGDQVLKDAKTRDAIAQDLNILCFEMEAAGIMDELPSLVIRGICDYCDSHKNKQWQEYAAITAAAYTKVLLSVVPTYCYKNKSSESREPIWMVPFRRNPQFVGREEEITRAEGLIMQQDGPNKVAFCGLGGVGKTQIALELAYRMRNRDSECSIFWITCTSYESVEQAYMGITSKLGMTDIKPAEAKEKVKAYLSQERAGKWLLLFDNIDDMEMWSKDNANNLILTDYLPRSEQGHIIFTTRNRKIAVKLVSSHVIPITELDSATSIQMLQNSLVEKSLLNDRDTAIALLERLAFLPLAITQATAYINENSIDITDYIILLEDQEPDVIELLSEDFGDETRYKDAQNPVALTWFISFQQIQRSDQLAANYLFFMACINPRNIPQSLLPQTISTKKRIEAIGLLKAFSFVSEGGDRSLNLHRLVRLATRSWMRKSQQFSLQIMKTADRLSEAFPSSSHTNRKEQGKYINFITNIAGCLHSDGRWKKAEELGIQVLELRKQGRWKEAEELEIQVLELRKQVLGHEHPDTLTSMNNLAHTWKLLGKDQDTLALMEQCVELSYNLLGPDHPRTKSSSTTLSNWKMAAHLPSLAEASRGKRPASK